MPAILARRGRHIPSGRLSSAGVWLFFGAMVLAFLGMLCIVLAELDSAGWRTSGADLDLRL